MGANSFEAGNGVVVSAAITNAPISSNQMFEDCLDGYFLFERGDDDLSSSYTFDIEVTGTATAGVDYSALPSSITIPAGESSVQVDIVAYLDGLLEGSESIIVTVLDNFCACDDDPPAELIILDNTPLEVPIPDQEYCFNDLATLSPTVDGGINPYTYQWSNGETTPSIGFNVIASTSGIYYVTVSDDCGNSATSSVNVTFQVPPPLVDITPPDVLCGSSEPVTLVASETGGVWSGIGITDADAGTFDPTLAQISANPPFSVTYTLSNNCGTSSDTFDINLEDDPTADISGTGMLCPGETADIDLSISFTGTGPWSFVYAIDGVEQPVVTNISDSPYTLIVDGLGDYTLVSVSDSQCDGTVAGLASIEEFTPPDVTISGGGTLCSDSETVGIDFTISDGEVPYDVTYTDGTDDFTETGVSGTFTLDVNISGNYEVVSIIDANGCEGTFSGIAEVAVSNLNIDSATPNTANCGSTDGSITGVSISGGEEPYSYFWYDDAGAPLGNDPDLNSIGMGTYTLIVIDNLLCPDTLEITVDETLPPTINVGVANDAYCSESNGSITGVSVNGGTEPYFYFWKDFSGNIIGNEIDLEEVTSGNYTLVVSDFNGCKDSIEMSIADIPPPNLTGGTPNHASCNENNGNITNIGIQSSSPPFNYVWTDENGNEIGENSIDLLDIPEGSYTLVVTDGNDCTQTLSFDIEGSEPPEINAATVQPSTCSEANGAVTDIFIQGGTTPLFYEWQNENGESIEDDLFLNGVPAGTYTLIVTDINDCTDTFSYTVTDEPSPIVNGGESSPTVCGTNSGSIIGVNVAGGIEPLSYQWRNNSDEIVGNDLDLQGVGLGDYTLVVTDANGCMDEISFGVLEIPGPSLTEGTAMAASCGDNNGIIEGVTISGGTEPYEFEWRNAADSLVATTQNLENVVSGVYTLVATDDNGCTASIIMEIGDIPPPEIAGGEVQPSSCGKADGGIHSVEVVGGTGELSYEWQNLSGEILGEEMDLANVPQGNYTLIVTDENGCEVSMVFDIADLAAPQLLGGDLQHTTCSESNGHITNVILESGVPPFIFEWHNAAEEVLHSGYVASAPLQLTDVASGTYTLLVTDSKGCAVSLQFTLEDTPSPQLIAGTTLETRCGEANGSISGVSIEGGTEPFLLEWRNELGEIVGNELDIDSLTTGNYFLQVTDLNNCSYDIEMFVPETNPPQLQGGLVTSTTCSEANGSIEGVEVIEGTSPYNYFWTNEIGDTLSTENTLADVLAGNYTLAVLDANDCLVSLQWTIEDQAAPELLGGDILPSSCGKADGAIQNIEAFGGTGTLVFEWQDASGEVLGNELDLTDIAAGEYTLFVTDENGCMAQIPFTTFDEAAPQLSGGLVAPSNCGQTDGNITDIQIEGGTAPYTYLWTNENGEAFGENIDLSDAPQGTYLLTASDVDGCVTTLAFEIVDTGPPALSGGLVTPTTCSEANGSIEGIEVVGGNGLVSFTWLDSENIELGEELDLNGVLTGTYTLIATDEKGCTAQLQFEIADEAAPQIIEGLVSNSRCSEANGGISNVVIEGGTPPYSYAWTDADSNVYGNTGTSGEATLLNIAAGTYNLEVMDANGCLANLAFEVLDEASPVALGATVNASTCSEANGSVEAVEIEGGTAPFSFEWRDVNGNLVGENEVLEEVLAGSYTVFITDDNGCETDLAFDISDVPAPILSEGTIDLSSCGNSDGGVLGVQVEGGTEPYSYRWQNADGEIFGEEIDLTDVAAGDYTLVVTDFNNCEVSLGFNVSDVGAPAINGGLANQTICGSSDGRITSIEVSGGTGALAVRWTNAAGEIIGENVEIFDLLAGEYTFTVEDESGCIASQNFLIEDIPPPTILGATLTPASCGASDGRISELVIEDGTEPFEYEWRDAVTGELLDNEPEISNLAAGSYMLILTDANLCSDSRPFVLENLDAPELSLEEVTISDCADEGTGSATVKVLGGTAPFSFEWDSAPPQFAPTATNLRPGTYTVSVRDGNDCLAAIPVTVPGFIPPPIVDCSFQTTDSLEFVWTAVEGAIGYSIETDLGITDTVSADELSYLLAGIPDDLVVEISVMAIGPDNCGNSEVVIHSCATLADCPTIDVSISVPNDVFCVNESPVNLTASPEGGVFEGVGMTDNSFDPALAGIGEHVITYTFVDEMGCDFSANQTMVIVDAPLAAMEMPDAICLGEMATVSFIGNLPEGADLQWDFGNGTTSDEAGPHSIDWNETGNYTVQLSIDNGVCMDEVSWDITVSDISIEASEDLTVRSGTEIDLNAIVNTEFGDLETLEWISSLDNLTGCVDCLNTNAIPFEPTNYTVIATNQHGCMASAEIAVDIIPVPILAVPNAFSPNGDGINDIFKFDGKNIESIDFKIFSRWGELLFEGHSLEDFWDGTYKEQPSELGVYVYYARAFSFDGEEVFVKGNVSLIR